MVGQNPPSLFDRFDQPVGKIGIQEMLAHRDDEMIPKLSTTLRMNAIVSDNRKLSGPRCDEDQDPISLVGLFHTEPLEFGSGFNQRLAIQLASLNVNANLPGGIRFRRPDCGDDAIVVQLAQKILRSHRIYQLPLEPPPPKLPPPPLKLLKPPPDDELPDHPPLPPPQPPRNGHPKLE